MRMDRIPLSKEQKAILTSNQIFLVANVPTQNTQFWVVIEEDRVLSPIEIRDIREKVGSTPSDHIRMLLDVLRWRGTVGMLDGFFRALKHTGNAHVVDVLHGRAVPDNLQSPSAFSDLNEALGIHKDNWAKDILTIPLFDYASRGKTDLSKLYVPLYLVHNKNDQTHLDTAEVKLERVIPTEMIFREYDGSLAPNTVLIEGMPGSGKTSFTKVYMYDWCKTQTPRGVLTWKLILYVPVTKITSSVEDAIKSAIAVKPLMQADVYNLLQLYPACCSVIFDGIDECRDDSIRQQLAEYIAGSKMGQKPKVIVTARTYLCGLDAGLFQRHLRCDGFTEQQVISYIDQFFVNDKDKATEIKQKVSIFDQSLTNPLKLYMACLGIEKGLIDISSCDRLSSTKLFLSQEQLLLQREQKKLSQIQTVSTDQLDEEFKKFTILTLQAMLRGERSLSPKMLRQAGIQDDSVVKVFLDKEYRFTLRGEEERWTYRHETLYEFLSARGLGFLPQDKCCVLLYICAQKEFRNLMVLFIGLLGHSSDDAESAEDEDTDEAWIEKMLKVCLVLQGKLDEQGIPELEKAKVKSIKDNIADLVKDKSVQSLIQTLCSPNATKLSAAQTEHKDRLCQSWTLALETFNGAVMKEPSQVFFGMMEQERYCGIITHLTACIQECQKPNLNIIHWVIPGHWRDMDGHGSLLEKDVYQVGDDRWVMVSYSIWQHGKARVFDAWSPDDAIYAWRKLQDSSREKQQQDELEIALREEHLQSVSQVNETTSCSRTAASSYQSLEFRLPSPRESFRVWGRKGQAPQHCFSTEAWQRFFDTVIAETREFHLYLAAETPLLPLLEAVLVRLDDLRAAVSYEMEIWSGHIPLEELICWLGRYNVQAPFACLKLRGIDVVSEDMVEDVLQRFATETVIDTDTLYCKRPVTLT